MGSINSLIGNADVSYDNLIANAQGKYNLGEVVFENGKFHKVNNHAGCLSGFNNVVTTEEQNRATNAAVFKALATHAVGDSREGQAKVNKLLDMGLDRTEDIEALMHGTGGLDRFPYLQEAFEFLMTGDHAAPLSRDELKLLDHLLKQNHGEREVKAGYAMLKDLRAMKAGTKEVNLGNKEDVKKAESWISGLHVKNISGATLQRVTAETVNKRAARTLEEYDELLEKPAGWDAKRVLFRCMPDLVNTVNENIRNAKKPSGDKLDRKTVDRFLSQLTAGIEYKFASSWNAIVGNRKDRNRLDALKNAVYDQLIDYMGESLYRHDPGLAEMFFFDEGEGRPLHTMLADITGNEPVENVPLSARGRLLHRLVSHNYAADSRFVETNGEMINADEDEPQEIVQNPAEGLLNLAEPRQLDTRELAQCLGISETEAANLRPRADVGRSSNGCYRIQTYEDRDDGNKSYTVMIDSKGVAFSQADYLYCAKVLYQDRTEHTTVSNSEVRALDYIDHREMKAVVRLARLLEEPLAQQKRGKGIGAYEYACMGNILTNVLVDALPRARRLSGDKPITLATFYKALKIPADVPYENSPHVGLMFAQALSQKFRADFGLSHPGLPQEETGASPHYTAFLQAVSEAGVRYDGIVNACKDRSTYSRDGVRYLTCPVDLGKILNTEKDLATDVCNFDTSKRDKNETGNITWNFDGQAYRFTSEAARNRFVEKLTEAGFKPRQIYAMSKVPAQCVYAIHAEFGLVPLWGSADVEIRKEGDDMKAVYTIKCEPYEGDSHSASEVRNVLRYEVSITQEGVVTCDSSVLVRGDTLKVLAGTVSSNLAGVGGDSPVLRSDKKAEIEKWSEDFVSKLKSVNGNLKNPFFVEELERELRPLFGTIRDYLGKDEAQKQLYAQFYRVLWGQVVHVLTELNKDRPEAVQNRFREVLGELKGRLETKLNIEDVPGLEDYPSVKERTVEIEVNLDDEDEDE